MEKLLVSNRYLIKFKLVTSVSKSCLSITFDVASKKSVTYYDALYLCTAMVKKCEMITFDRKLKASVEGTQFESMVKLIV